MGRSLADTLVVGGAKVKPTARSLVKPATPTPDHWLSLSNLDRVVNPTFSSAILFYTKLLVRSNMTFVEVVQSLKASLAMTLVHFYPFAGRLALRDDGLVDLHCNDQGAIVIEAVVDADLEELGGPQPMPALSGLEVARLGPGPRYVPDQLQSMPTLVIQVTHFQKCGSVAVVVNWHHTVADGSAGCHFMKSWSEIAMGKEISLKPDHNREQLRPRAQRDSSMVKGYSTRRIQDLLPSVDLSSPLPTEPVVLKSFPLSRKAAQGLKAQAKTDSCAFTTVESISGFLWKTMTKARRAAKDCVDDQVTRFFMFVDGRKKLGMSPGYFGNVVCSACAIASEKEIATKPNSYATGLINDAIKSISGEYFRSLVDWVEEQGKVPSKSEHMNSLGRDVAATFWVSFPLYEVDFGWGKPDFAARNSSARPLIDGIAMMANREGSGMVAILNLHSDRLAKLEKDPDFSSSFSEPSEPRPSLQHSENSTCSSKDTTICTIPQDSVQNVDRAHPMTSIESFVQTSAQQTAVTSQLSLLGVWTFCIKAWIMVLALAWSLLDLRSSLVNCHESRYNKADGPSTQGPLRERSQRLQSARQRGGLLPRIKAFELIRGAYGSCMKACTAVVVLGRAVVDHIDLLRLPMKPRCRVPCRV